MTLEDLRGTLLLQIETWDECRRDHQKLSEKHEHHKTSVAFGDGVLLQLIWNIDALGFCLEREALGLGGMAELVSMLKDRVSRFERAMSHYGKGEASTPSRHLEARATADGSRWASSQLLSMLQEVWETERKAKLPRRRRGKGKPKPFMLKSVQMVEKKFSAGANKCCIRLNSDLKPTKK